MKTDLEKFTELYKEFGIELKLIEKNDGVDIILAATDDYDHYTTSEKFNGYRGFCSDIKFDKDGKFISQGFWE